MTEAKINDIVIEELKSIGDELQALRVKLKEARSVVTGIVNECIAINSRQAKLKGILDATK